MAASGAAAISSRRWRWARARYCSAAAMPYGLAAGGEKGVTRALSILHADLVRTMKLLGCASLAELDPSYLQKR